MSDVARDPSTEDIDQLSLLESLRGVMSSSASDWREGACRRLAEYFGVHPEDTWTLALQAQLRIENNDVSAAGKVAGEAIDLGHAWAAEPTAFWAIQLLRHPGAYLEQAMPILGNYTRATDEPPQANPLFDIARAALGNGDVSLQRVLHLFRMAALQPKHVEKLNQTVASAESLLDQTTTLHNQLVEELGKLETEAKAGADRLETQVKTTGLLVRQVSAGAVESAFRASSTVSKAESQALFRWGLVALGVAVVVAVIPLIWRGNLSDGQLLAAHASATLAIGAVAGVLLGRSRSRDRAGQRQGDLAIAMTEVSVYAENITDLAERQKWMQTMGQAVLIAHLQPDSGGSGGDGQPALATLLASYSKQS